MSPVEQEEDERADRSESAWRWAVAFGLAALALAAGWLVSKEGPNEPESLSPAAAVERPLAVAPPAPPQESVQPAEHPADQTAAPPAAPSQVVLSVLHKHTFGSCQGKIVASPGRLAYEATSGSDALSARFDALEGFEVDTARRTLRVKQRSGRTWNFMAAAESGEGRAAFDRGIATVQQWWRAGR